MRFSGAAASVAGFTLIAKRPGAFAIWCLFYLVGLVCIGVAAVLTIMPVFVNAGAAGASAGTGFNPTAFAAGFVKNWPFFLAAILVLMLGILAFYSMLYGAVFRSILRPEQKGFGSIRLGGDELRLMGLFLIVFGVCLVLMIPAALVLGLVAVVLKASGFVGMGVLVVLMLALEVLVLARFGLAAPQTFYERRITLTGSLDLTRKAVGSMVLMVLLTVVAVVLVSAVDIGVQWALQGNPFRPHVPAGNPVDVTHALMAAPIVFVCTIVFSVLQLVIGGAPFAVAYKALSSRTDQAETFA